MVHPFVTQLRFARDEFRRGLSGLGEEDAQHRLLPMNSISWIVGHLAWQEQRYWLHRAQGIVLRPDISAHLAYGQPASTPPLADMWEAWHAITAQADQWLDTLTTERMQAPLAEGLSNVGTYVRRTTYHYWYHLGEAMSIRQLLGHGKLPDFVGNIDQQAPYEPE